MIFTHLGFHFYLVVVIAVLSGAAIGIGLKLEARLLEKRPSSWLLFSLAYFFGQTLLATLMFITSWVFPAPVNIFLLLMPLAMGWWWLGQGLAKMELQLPTKPGLIQLLIGGCLLGVLAFNTLYAFHRPSEWDEVAYHVPVMQEIAAGSLQFPLLQTSPYIPFYQPFSSFYGSLPYASEAYAGLGYSLANDHPSAAHVLNMVHFGFFLLVIYSFLRQFFQVSRSSSLLVLVLMALDPGLTILLATGLVDINVSLFQVLSCLLLILAQKEKKAGYLWFSLLCLGAAFGHKFTTAYLLPVYLPWLYLVSKNIVSLKELSLKGILWGVVGGGIWYLKNLFLHLNPVYPLYFGHSGMLEKNYTFLIDTLIADLRSPVSMISFLKSFFLNYQQNLSLILATLFLGLSFLLTRKSWGKTEYGLLLSAFSIYSLNFFIGSQLSRYVLFLPMVVYMLVSKYIHRSVLLSLLLLSVSIFAQFKSVPLKAFWQARWRELPVVLTINHESDTKNKIGCVASVFSFCTENCDKSKKVLNLWDAYAAVYYEDVGMFYTPNISTFSDLRVPPEVKYVFTNHQWKKALLLSPNSHRDMEPLARAEYEDNLLQNAEVIFEDDACSLSVLTTER